MKGTPAVYLGRHVSKENFRTNVYGPKGEKKLVESWAAFEAAMESGLWFATQEDALQSLAPVEEEVQANDEFLEDVQHDRKPKPKNKQKHKNKPKPVKIEEMEEDGEIPSDELDDMVFEVTDDNK